MTSRSKAHVTWLVGVVALAGLLAAPPLTARRAQAPASTQTVGAGLDASLLGGISFRHLSVFSRGGRSTAVAGVVGNEQLYYMGSTGGGVWQTTDAGTTWTNISDGFFEAGSIGAIAVAASNASVIYVGTGSACPRGNISPGVGMYKSSDAGKTWQHIGLRNAGSIGRIQVHPTNPNLVYVAVLGNLFAPSKERGVYRSRDGGGTWELVHHVNERTGAVDLTMDPKNPDILIAGLWTVERKPWSIDSGSPDGGMVRSTDGGTTWTRLSAGLPKSRMGRVGVSISGASSQRVYAQIEADNDEGGTFRSDDGGLTWSRTFAGRNLQQRAWYYTHVQADPVDVDTVYALNVGAFKSTDGSKSFQNAGINSHSDHHDLWINPRNNKAMVEANDGGATVSVNGSAWTGQENQPTSEIYRLAVDTRWPYWVYGAQQDNNTVAVPSQGSEATYAVGGGESGHIAVDPRDYNIVYAGSYGGSLSRIDRKFNRSEDVRIYADMQTGQRAADMKYRQQWNSPIRISPHTPDVVYTTSQYVHRTTNGGLDWSVISPDLTRNDKRRQQYSGAEGITQDNTGVEVYGTIFAFEESPTTPGVLWAGSDDGLVHVSRNNGRTWQNVTPANWPEGCINSIDISVHDPGRVTVAMYRYRQGDFAPYLYQTNDFGRTWRRLADGTNGIPGTHFTRVVREDPARRGLLYAGTEFGFYVSFNDGARWESLQLGLPRTPVTDIKIYRDDLIVTTQGRGFWVLENMSPLRTTLPGTQAATSAILYKPEDAYRAGAQLPTFYYWFRETPTAPVTVEVADAKGAVVFTRTSQPGTPPPPIAVAGAGGGRGGRGGGGGGAGVAAAEVPPGGRAGGGGAGMAPAGATPAGAAAGRGAAVAGGTADAPPAGVAPVGGGGRGGRGGGGAPAANGYASAIQGMNRAGWTNFRTPTLFTVPQGTVLWGGGGGGGGPKVPPGTYRVKVTSGNWSQTQTFWLGADPRQPPTMTEAEGAEQFRLSSEIGQMINTLYTDLARIRDAKRQAAQSIEKLPADSPMRATSAALTDKLIAVESELTQIQGEGGQDALNFPGRMDNQLLSLYSGLVGPERRLGTPALDRYRDLKPVADKLLAAAKAVLAADVERFNAAAAKAGVASIAVK
jgi:photosystem II stability/assembly factor-like uncharacterized protein